MYTNLLERSGVYVCLLNNLKASNKGCNNPTKETLLGPKRMWNKPITLRSNNVKKATDNKTNKIWSSQENKNISKDTFLKRFL